MTNEKYLGEEKIYKLLIKFSLPCILSLIISSTYNLVDQLYIGNSISQLAKTAAGVVFPIILIPQAFALWFGDGCAARLSINNGSKNTSKSHNCVGTSITITFAVSIVLTLTAWFLREPLLRLFGASDNTIEMSMQYFSVMIWFFPAFMLMNTLSAIIRADGSPAYAMISMAVGAAINVALDALFIFAFNLGIAGAAWATVIGQTASFAISAAYLLRSKTFKLNLKSFVPDFAELAQTVKLGLSSMITQTSIAVISLVSYMMLSRYGAISQYGTDIPINAMATETQVFTLIINVVMGVALGGQPILGYNLGRNLDGRVKRTYLTMMITALTIGVIATAVIEIWPQAIIGIFGKGDDLYHQYAEITFRVFLSTMILTCFIKTTSVFFQAVNCPVKSAVSSLTRDLICFVPLMFIMPAVFESNQAGSGVVGLLWAAPIADGIGAAVSLALTLAHFLKRRKTEPRQTSANAD
ncbi:MAG: MATE family efflux transporter [Corallococcus sp.]|nr:MATE family efflux transporter [Corallococcus sp.]